MDFSSFIAKGVSAEERARTNRSEIHSVIGELRGGVESFFAGKLSARFARLKKQSNYLDIVQKMLNPEYYNALIIEGAKNSNIWAEVCEISLSDEGYPVTVKFSGRNTSCEDSKQFALALGQVISSAVTGKIMLDLKERVLEQEAADAAKAAEETTLLSPAVTPIEVEEKNSPDTSSEP